MAISFPLSPTLNQTYTVGSKTWIYNGYAWDIVTANLTPTSITANAAFDKANSANVLAYSNSVSLSTNVNTLAAAIISNNATQGANIAALAASFVSNSQSLSANVNTLAATFVAANANAQSLSANVNTLAASFASNSQSLSANVNTLAATFVAANANAISLSTNVNTLAATFVSANANAVSLSANVNTLAGAYATTRDSLTSNWAVSNLSSVIANSAFLKANNALANTSGVTFDGNLTIDGNTTVLGTVLTSSGISSSENGVLRIVNPGGAANSQALVSITGAIKIRLPAGANNAGAMMRMTVQIYDYAGTSSGTSRSLEIGGYNYAGGNWYNIFATQQTMGGGSVNVRFGYDTVSECIWIGETSTTWYYPRVAVTDFMAGNAALANFQDGWRISFETAFDTVEQTIVAAKPIDVVNYTSYAPSLTTFNAANANTVSLSTNVNVLAASFVSNSQTLSANVNTLAAAYVTFTNIFSQANANAVSLSANVNTLAAAVVSNNATQGANIAALAANVNTIAGAITNLTLENVPTAFVKRSVTAATTANIALYGTQTIDGVAVSAGNRVLVKDQTLSNQNGLYVVSATAWSRSADADVIGDIASALVAVDAGTTNGGKLYDNDIKITDTLETTSIVWNRVIDDGAIYTYAAPVTAYGALNVAYLAANTNAQTLSANVNTLAATFVAANANNISLSANVNTLAATFVLANANSVSLSTNVNTLAANVNTLAGAAYNKSGGTISGDVSITGSLTVSGTQSYINTQTLLIGDNLVVLNADLPGNITPTENAGLEVNRGSAAANAALIWVEAADAWAFTGNANAAITTYIASNTDIATLTANTVSLSTNVNVLAAAVVSNNATQGANIAALAAITTANTVGTRFLGTANNADLLDGLHSSYFLANTSGTSYNGDIFVPAGNLSVGTTNTMPSFRMQVYDALNAGLVFRNPTNYTVLAQSGGDYYLDLNRGGSAGNFVLRNSSNLNEQFRVDSKGSVGIGTASPLGVLDLGNATSGRGIVWGGAGNHYASIWTPYSSSGLVLGTGMKGNTYVDAYDSSYGGGAFYRSAIRLNYTSGGIQFFANGSQTITANAQFTPQEVMRITETSRVGIVNQSPSYTLDVTGTGRASTDFRAPVFYDSDDTNYFLNPAGISVANTFGIQTGQFSAYYAALNVSKGQGSATTYRDIDIHGSWVTGEAHAITAVHSTGNTNIVGQMAFQYDGTGSRIGWGRLYHVGDSTTMCMNLVSTSLTAAYLEVNGSVRSPVFYDSDNTSYFLDPAASSNSAILAGNVAIGTTTPGSRLTVDGGSLATTGTGLSMAGSLATGRLLSGGGSNLQTVHTYFDSTAVEISAGSTSGYVSGIGLGARSYSGTGGDAVTLWTRSAERVRIDNTGDVGIGITNPTSRLHVNAAPATAAVVGIQSAYSNTSAYLQFLNSSGSEMGYVGYGSPISGQMYVWQTQSEPMVFGTNNTVRMSIGNNGNVGIGQGASATYRLGVTAATAGIGVTTTSSTSGLPGLALFEGAMSAVFATSTSANTVYFGSYSSNTISFITGNSTKMTLGADGNIGIGVSPAPATRVLSYSPDAIYQLGLIGTSKALRFASTASAYQIAAVDTTLSVSYQPLSITGSNVTIQSTSGTVFIDAGGNVGVGTTSPSYKLHVNGSFAATTKSFVIDHPTKPGMKLRYGSLEGPENGVYVRGRLDGEKVINLPDYWEGLVDLDTITVNLTSIGHGQNLYVAAIDGLKVHIDTENHTQPYCFYHVYAERKDVDKLVVEFEE